MKSQASTAKLAERTITASEFRAKCLALMDEVARTGVPLLITKRGKVCACVKPPLREDQPTIET